MYVQFDWKLEDVMRVMQTYNFFATKRQYTKKLKDWGCRKYRVLPKDDIPVRPTLSNRDPSSQTPDETSYAVFMDIDSIAPNAAQAGSHKEDHNLGVAATVELPDIMNDTINAETDDTTAEGYIVQIQGDDHPWTHGYGTGVRSFGSNVGNMDGVLDTIPEERPASSLSGFERSSTEDTSGRDYSSISSIGLALGESGSLSRSPNPMPGVPSSPAPLVRLSGEWLESTDCISAEQDPLSPDQDANTVSVDLDWDMADTSTAGGVLLEAILPTGSDPNAHPVLMPTQNLTRDVSPMALLLMIESSRVSGELSQGDIFRIEQLAEIFECARSYHDAYQLRRLVFLQAADTSRVDSTGSHAWERALVNVVKSADNTAAFKETAAFVKQAWRDHPNYVNEQSTAGCVQQSCLGSMFRARADFRSAEHHCRRAFDKMLTSFVETAPLHLGSISDSVQSEGSSRFVAAWLVVLTNLLLTWEKKEKLDSIEAWDRVEALCPEGLVPHKVRWERRVHQIVGWCLNTLAEDGFWKMLLPITPDLWLLAPNEADLRDVESTLLFFYLFGQTQPGHFSNQNWISDSVKSQSSCVLEFAQIWGISVAEVLSVVANFIIVTNGLHESGEKSTLARRAFTTARAVYHSMKVKGGSMDEGLIFMESYAAVRRQKDSQFSTGKYATLVRTAVRDIVERCFHLVLEVSALRDPRLQNRLSQASMAPSYSPTMLSTPRSSWSGFRSFKSIGRRGSKFWANNNNSNNEIQSLLSSHRGSRASSTKSALTLLLTTPSSRDVIMEDDIDI